MGYIMARARNIKPGFFVNDELGDLPPLARLLFIGLWTLADAEGRLEDKPRKIKTQILPYDNCDAGSLLNNLDLSGFIQRYTVQGQHVIQVVTFSEHQNPHKNEREKGSKYGAYDERDEEVEEIQEVTQQSRLISINRDKDGTNPDESLLPITSSLNPESLLPDSLNLKDDPLNVAIGSTDQIPPKAKKKKPAQSAKTWEFYIRAYNARYGIEPVRNATVNGQMANFVKRVPLEEAHFIAEHYVHHNNSFYVNKCHPVGLMLSDAEKLRTEWATNRQMTRQTAHQVDQRQTAINTAEQAQVLFDQARADK